MKAATYDIEAATEATHWWFVGRRILFNRMIKQLGVSNDARLLDIGTSTGGNLRMLRESGFANVEGLDFSDSAIRWCAEKGLGPVRKGDVCDMPFDDSTFDLVLATDIVEHVDDDGAALAEIRRILKPGGHAIVTVPAFKILWGLQDEVSHHKRRYRGSQIREKIEAVGLTPHNGFYFNYLLFLPILLARTLMRGLRLSVHSEAEVNSPLINRILAIIFRIDIALAPVIKPPFGVSYLVVASRE